MRPKPVKQALSKITTAKAVPCASPRSKAVVLSVEELKHHIFARRFVVTTNDGKIRKDAVTSTNVSVIRLCDILVQLGAPHESNPSIKGGYLDQGPHG